ncbi:hypothetical protein COU17_02405 [Candidatus Kaiserbacteria bacterium CG10_big_fil_rev_8_21_14_0_10_49_17]|uniref:VTT domain-containing protein n=1 Tax=Candidatus Kaiserbacteria bacterium CG10_big_fil_rev_8_21_14_0_10_49_17 TaxID=1974609 RepID=A0A2M6WE46_9BACT|nr:MAG: hypothetical protein COU17_02405 [Candidatus Kaiserbacteria bacterium CG10_big_fil_rev_8_21_14_0_10_49_17]
MFSNFYLMRERGVEWFKARAHSTHAKVWLCIFSFTESSFFFIAPDVLLVAMLLVDSRRWLYYTWLVTITSLLGALFGYIVAAFFYDSLGVYIIDFYHLSDEMVKIKTSFDANAGLVMFLAAFTPIPYKVFVLAGGFFKINLAVFLFASLLGRGARYLILAFIVHRFRDRALRILSQYSVILTILTVVTVILFIFKEFLF